MRPNGRKGFLIAACCICLLYGAWNESEAACVRNHPSIDISPTKGFIKQGTEPANEVYHLTVTNNDTSDCVASTFVIEIESEAGNTPSFSLPSVLGSSSTGSLAPGHRYMSTLAVTANMGPTDGHKLRTVVRAVDAVNHSNKTGKGSVETGITAKRGTAQLLIRDQEETCHACHKTDRNRTPSDPDWNQAIKKHNAFQVGSSKWSSLGGWGVAGGKYGEFFCTTCHIVHNTGNIYLIRESARTPDGSDWESSGASNVTCLFSKKKKTHNPNPGNSVGAMGDDSDGHTSSSRVCEVCHSITSHHRYNTSGQADGRSHYNDWDCTACHNHKNGFKGCASGNAHTTHLTEEYGPKMTCVSGNYGCHGNQTPPLMSDSENLAGTTVCDVCHSKNGYYNGVNSVNDSVGAKDNWPDGVYSGGALKPGKEKWCAGCHDEVPSVIDGVNAPNVIGNETAAYIYGTGWGFYRTGHGTPSTTKIPSNGYDSGPGLTCSACHDYSQPHIDGNRRTFSASGTPNDYRIGYRLKLVGGQNPMEIPWSGLTSNSVSQYRICTQAGCHDTSPSPFVTSSAHTTNFWNDARTDIGNNLHSYHLSFTNQLRWSPDWSTSATSRISCPACHNVHGSKYLAMINDGELVSDTVERRPGLRIWYWDSVLSTWNESHPDPPSPEDIPLTMSDGWVWRGATSSNLCSNCHGNNNTVDVQRALWQGYPVPPVLAWTGETGYANDGANPDSASAADTFTFRIKYSDANNDAPSYVRLRIDRNDDGDYADAGETVTMDPVDPLDTSYYNGNIYTTTLTLAKNGDNVISYFFEASDGVSGSAMTDVRTVTVTNASPQLLWTGEAGYIDDGVNPDSGAAGVANFEFRITYKDADGEAPSGGAPTLYIDKNDDGDFSDAGEAVLMTDMGDPSFITGKRFNHTTTLTRGSDNFIAYRFEASDGIAAVQTETRTVAVLESVNFAPVLDWTGETDYVSDGVDPNTGPGGNQYFGGPFVFRVKYSDANNDPPASIQVWVDRNDDGDYLDANEKIDMEEDNTGDSDYTDGKIYKKTVFLMSLGDGTLNYRFYANDGIEDASGTPTSSSTVTVINAREVDDGGADYSTIQAAVTAAGSGDYILVNDGTYSENITISKVVHIHSVNGPSATTITQSGTNRPIAFNNGAGASTLKGFTVTGGSGVTGAGIYVNMSQPTIDNCIITGNDATASYDGGGITVVNSVSDVTIKNTTISYNNGYRGGGLNLGTGTNATITNCIFDHNTAVTGGAIAFLGNDATTTVTGSTFSNNSSSSDGGAFHINNNIGATFRKCVITGNHSATQGGVMTLTNATADPVFENSVIANNYAPNGGVFYGNGGDAKFTNCTLTGNQATVTSGGGGGIAWICSGAIIMRNGISWNNTAVSNQGHNIYRGCTGSPVNIGTITYSDFDTTATTYMYNATFTDDRGGGTNISPEANPNFVGGGNYHLTSSSTNVIDHALASDGPGDDIDSQTRVPLSGMIDMGADEKE